MNGPRDPNSAACHECMKRRKATCNGACPCPVDGDDIKQHIAIGYCPAGNYEWEGFGSLLAWTLYRTGCTSLFHRIRHLFEPAPKRCKCMERQRYLNNRFRGLWLWCLSWANV